MIPKDELSSFSYVLDEALIYEMSLVGKLQSFRKNDIIIDVGQELAFVPLLLSGNIKVMREDDNGHDLLLYVLESGDTCAMSLTCCMSKSVSKIRAVADSDTQLVMIPIDKMTDWFNNNNSWRMFILQSYQVRFNEMLETIDTLAFLKMDERLYKYLTDQVKLSSSEVLNITHQNIAEDLNTSRVVISRLLKQLEKDGRITLGRNKITVLEYV
ncbi:MAG: Crp/Fnr family transcriptional regulator [Bacteroidota bacterium]